MKRLFCFLMVFILMICSTGCSLNWRVFTTYFSEGKMNIATMLKNEEIVEIVAVNGRRGGVRTIGEKDEIDEIIDLFLDNVYVELDEEKVDQLAQHHLGAVPDTWVLMDCYTKNEETISLIIFYDTGLELTVCNKKYMCEDEFSKDYLLLKTLLYEYGGEAE